MPLDRFFDKDIIDFVSAQRCDGENLDYRTVAVMQLGRDMKALILAIRSLKAELDGEI